MKTVAFHTLGCKLNFAESSTIARSFKDAGWSKVDFGNYADVTVINTCSVTEQADRECKTIVNRALAANPSTFIAVIGCYAQLKPLTIAGIKGVDLVLGANEKFNIISYLEALEKRPESRVVACDIEDVTAYHGSFSSGDRTRVFLKAQDGCSYNCTFCTIPLARGISRSDSVENIVTLAKEAVLNGAKEIILTGVNLGDFGMTGNKRINHFIDLVNGFEEMKEDFRVRISSIEPNLLSNAIIDTVASSGKFMPHFHIPLQSGSNKILKLMRRRYQRELYAEKVEYIKSRMPHCSIGADVITGFPGELASDFRETFDFVNALDLSYLHVFTYSERVNTLASGMDQVVPVSERRERNRQLRSLSVKKSRSFYNSHAGTFAKVLMEDENKNGFMHGYSENYIRVKVPYDSSLTNRVIPVMLDSIGEDGNMNAIITEEVIYS